MKQCVMCNLSFFKNPKYSKKQWEEALYCSPACGVKARTHKINTNCDECHAKFTIKRYRKLTAKFCSNACRVKNKDKGGYIIDELGYKRFNKTKKREHALIAELHLGRRLFKEEVVHHLNGDKLDNRISNLLVMTRSWHTKIHNPRLGTGVNRKVERCS